MWRNRIAQLALELEDLREKHVPRTHRHPPLPVPLRGRVDALASRRPRVEEHGGAAGARQHADRHVPPAGGLGAETPDVRAKPFTGNEACDAAALVLEVRRRHARAQVQLTERDDRGGGQRRLQVEWHGTNHQPFDQERAVRAGRARRFAELAEDILLPAQRLGEADDDQIEIAALDDDAAVDRRFRHDHAVGEAARRTGRGGRTLHLPRPIDELLHADRERLRQQQHASLRIDGQAGAEIEAIAARRERQAVAERHARPAGLVRQVHQPAEVELFDRQIARAQELAVEVVQPGQRRRLRDHRDAVLLGDEHQRSLGHRGVVVRHPLAPELNPVIPQVRKVGASRPYTPTRVRGTESRTSLNRCDHATASGTVFSLSHPRPVGCAKYSTARSYSDGHSRATRDSSRLATSGLRLAWAIRWVKPTCAAMAGSNA